MIGSRDGGKLTNPFAGILVTPKTTARTVDARIPISNDPLTLRISRIAVIIIPKKPTQTW